MAAQRRSTKVSLSSDQVWALRELNGDFPGLYRSLSSAGLVVWVDDLGYQITDEGRAWLQTR